MTNRLDDGLYNIQNRQIQILNMPRNATTYLLDGQTLTTTDLDMIINQNLQIGLTEEAWQRVKKSRQAIHNMMSDNKKIVYGINTGFGNFADKIISYDERTKLQNNLIRSHSVCVGKPLPLATVKRMMVLRINTLCKGRSGIEPENLQKYIKACNINYMPMIPEKGTVGASGDLAPLSHLALGMMGEGLAWCEEKGQFGDAADIMGKKGLKPIVLKEKEGLALINGTQFMSSIVSEVETMSRHLLSSAILIYAFAVEIFGLDPQLLSEESVQFYSEAQPSLGKTLKYLKSILNLQLSQLHQFCLTNAHKNKKAASITQSLQNLSSLLESLDFQMNGATDNPLVYCTDDGFEEDKLISAGNFHGEYVAKASDFISMGLFGQNREIHKLTNLQSARVPDKERRPEQWLHDHPIHLGSPALGVESPYKTCVSGFDHHLRQPGRSCLHGWLRGQEKQASSRKYFLMCALQAVDIVGKKPSEKLSNLHRNVRKRISYAEQDKYFGPHLEIAKNLVQNDLVNLI